MYWNLKNKTAVITGAAGGLGFQIAEHFLRNGAKAIIIIDSDQQKGLKAAQLLQSEYGSSAAEYCKRDVTKDLNKVIIEVTDKYKTIDILVNNSGAVNDGDTRRVIKIHLLTVIDWSKKFFNHMRIDEGGKGGTIINLSSIYGFRSDRFAESYVAAKHGVLGFTKCLGHKDNFEAYGVRVIALCPGFTKTNLKEGVLSKCPNDLKEFITTQKQWQNAEEVGKAAVEIYEKAESGSAWIIEGGKPVEELRPSEQ